MTAVEALDAVHLVLDELHENRTATASAYESDFQRSHHLGISRLLCQFDPIGLEEMDRVALLDRTDTKYVVSTRQLHSALRDLDEHYRVLDIRGNRLNRYRTVYFDTDALDLYMSHHSGKRARYKVRSREYVDTSESFLEVKRKAKRGRTVKDRVRTTDFVTRWVPESTGLIESRLPGEARSLEPQVTNEFYRATLVGNHDHERVTLDLNLQFHGSGRTVFLPGIAVLEVKQGGLNRNSVFVRQMRAAGIRPSGFSKYCMGVSLLYQDVKHNRFMPNLRLIGRLMGGDQDA